MALYLVGGSKTAYVLKAESAFQARLIAWRNEPGSFVRHVPKVAIELDPLNAVEVMEANNAAR